jgi:adenine/guanine phosphoribosyltransferase-like PRPP-binding protein
MAYFKASQKGVGRAGKQLLERLVNEVGHDGSSVFSSDAIVELPGGIKVSAPAFLEGCSSLEVRDLLASGPTVSGLASLIWGARTYEAGFVAELDEDGARVHRLRLFWEG